MTGWLKEEFYPISEIKIETNKETTNAKDFATLGELDSDSGILVPSLFSVLAPDQEYSLYLRDVTILNNKKLIGLSTAVLHSIVVNGLPDMTEKKPFWTWQMAFPNVGDGTKLGIDSEFGIQVFTGKPLGFLNFYVLVSRDVESVREFASLLQKNMDAKNVGSVVGDLIPIFSALNPTAAILSTASKLVTDAVQATMAYFQNRKDPIIGAYVTTLPKEKDYGVGLHPSNYPDSLIDCQGTMEIGYEVTKYD